MAQQPTPGTDTATGTDPDAKYDGPGYEDKSLGQAVNQDQQLVDELSEKHRGDTDAAEEEFREKSAGAPTLARQQNESDELTDDQFDRALGETAEEDADTDDLRDVPDLDPTDAQGPG